MTRWPLIVRGLVIAASGVAIAVGGCAAFVQGSTNVLGAIGGLAFVGGVVAPLIGLVMSIVGPFEVLQPLRQERRV